MRRAWKLLTPIQLIAFIKLLIYIYLNIGPTITWHPGHFIITRGFISRKYMQYYGI